MTILSIDQGKSYGKADALTGTPGDLPAGGNEGLENMEQWFKSNKICRNMLGVIPL